MDKILFKSIITILVILLIYFAGITSEYFNKQVVTAKVLDKERITEIDNKSSKPKSESYYLVFTDKGTFELSDQFFFWKFNSSDMYGGLSRDSIYTFEIYGIRILMLSIYPNIRSYSK